MIAVDNAGRKTLSYSCPADIYDLLTKVCEVRGCSRSWLITKALRSMLEKENEDARDYEQAVAAWKEFEEGGRQGITLDELRRNLNL